MAPAAAGTAMVAVVVVLELSGHSGIHVPAFCAVLSPTLQCQPFGAVSPVAPFIVTTMEVQGPVARVIVPAVAPPVWADGVQPVGAIVNVVDA